MVDELTAIENIQAIADHVSADRASAGREVERQLSLSVSANGASARGRQLNLFERRMVEIAKTLIGRPKAILMDEPGAGLNEVETEQLRRLLVQIPAAFACQLVLIDHDADLIASVCVETLVLDFGKRLAMGPTRAVLTIPSCAALIWDASSAMAEPELTVRNLFVARGGRPVLRDVSISIPPGRNHRASWRQRGGQIDTRSDYRRDLAGAQRPHLVRRCAVAGQSARISAAAGHGAGAGRPSGSDRPLGARQSGAAALMHTRREADREIEAALEIFPELRNRLSTPAQLLSGGQKQMVVIAQAMISRPHYLLIDELSFGLAPSIVSRLGRDDSDYRPARRRHSADRAIHHPGFESRPSAPTSWNVAPWHSPAAARNCGYIRRSCTAPIWPLARLPQQRRRTPRLLYRAVWE